MSEKLEFLKEVYLFHNIGGECIRVLLETMQMRRYQKGEDIIREGEQGDSIFILFEGSVSVTKKMTLFADDLEKSRVDKALIRLKDTDHAFFGEMSMCGEGAERSATVRAESECLLGEVAAADIQKMVEGDTDFGRQFYQNLATVVANRLRKANRDILKLTTALTLALEA